MSGEQRHAGTPGRSDVVAVGQATTAGATRNAAGQRPQGATELGGEELPWEEWLGLAGVGMSGWKVGCSPERYLDLQDVSAVEVHTQILHQSGAGFLRLQTAFSTEGPWRTVQSYTDETDASFVASSAVDSPYELARYLRWEIEAGSPWSWCFRIGVSVESELDRKRLERSDPDARGNAGARELVPWTYLRASFGTPRGEYHIQDRDHWLETAEMRYLALEAEAALMTGATLVLESAFSEEGPWVALAAITTAYTLQRIAMSWEENGSIPPLGRFVRWHLEGTGSPWHACFRVNAKWS